MRRDVANHVFMYLEQVKNIFFKGPLWYLFDILYFIHYNMFTYLGLALNFFQVEFRKTQFHFILCRFIIIFFYLV